MLRSMAESIMAIALDLAINIDQESTNDAYASFSDRSFPFMLAFLIILLLSVCPKTPFSSLACLFFNRLI